MQGVSLVKISGDEMLLNCVGITLCVEYHPRLREWWRHGYVFYLPQADERATYFKKLQEEGYMSVGIGAQAAPVILSRYTTYVQVALTDDVDVLSLYAYSLSYTTAALVDASTPKVIQKWLQARRVPCYDLMDDPLPIEVYVRDLRVRIT